MTELKQTSHWKISMKVQTLLNLCLLVLECETHPQVPEIFGPQNNDFIPIIIFQHSRYMNMDNTMVYKIISEFRIRMKIHTLIACCVNSIAIRRPNSSPATRVNLLIIEQAPKTASKNSKNAVHAHTLPIQTMH